MTTSTLPRRDVAFLEKTARALPDQMIRRAGVAVCFGSIAQAFTYNQTHQGGSMTRLTREQAETLMSANQLNAALDAHFAR